MAGLQAVLALFECSPSSVLRLFYDSKLIPQIGHLCALMAKSRKPYREVGSDELTKIAGTLLHGGVVAIAEPQMIKPFSVSEAKSWATSSSALLFLDGIGNPHNLGAIARSLAFFGFDKLILSSHPNQTGLSDAAYRIAEGGLEYLKLYRTGDLVTTLMSLKTEYYVVGTALISEGIPLTGLDSKKKPIALILGNEEQGLSQKTLNACDAVLTLKGMGHIQSLNVSASAAIIVHYLSQLGRQPASISRETKKPA